MKKCTKCLEEKLLIDFYLNASSKDGHRSQCKTCVKSLAIQRRVQNRDKILAQEQDWRDRNRDKLSAKYKIWSQTRIKNGKQARYMTQYYKKLNNRLAYNLRKRLRAALKGNRKVGSSVRGLGCSIEDLRVYLENKFRPGMSWKNYGKVWNIDHIVPLSVVDLTDKAQITKVCHYTNLQPLFVFENSSKNDRL